MPPRVALSATLAGLLSLVPIAGSAAKLETQVHGSYRVLFWNQSDLDLGLRDHGQASPDRLGATNFLEHRLRVGSLFTYGKLEFDLEVDALNGLVNTPAGGLVTSITGPEAGPLRPEPADPLRNRAYGLSFDSFAVRRAMLSAGLIS